MEDKKILTKADPLDDFDICKTCSTTDCTGLIPSLPQTDSEVASYAELYNFLPAVVRDELKDEIP